MKASTRYWVGAAAVSMGLGFASAAQAQQVQDGATPVRNRVEAVLEESGVDESEAREQASTIARRVQSLREQYSQDLRQELERGLRQAGLSETQARTQAARLARRIERDAGEMSYAAAGMSREDRQAWLSEEIEEAFADAGASRDEARQAAQTLSRQITDDTSEDDIQRRIMDQMQEADIPDARAARASDRLASRLHDVLQGENNEVYGFAGGRQGAQAARGALSERQVQNLEQQFSRAGVSEARARTEAQQLGNRWSELRSREDRTAAIARSLRENSNLSQTEARERAEQIVGNME